MKYDISHAIRNLYPNGAKFVQEGLEYSGLKWFDETKNLIMFCSYLKSKNIDFISLM